MDTKTRKYCEKHGIATEKSSKRHREETPIAVQPVPSPALSNGISFEEKVDLAERVRKSDHDVLAEVVKIVEAGCKGAIEELDSERLQIKVDNLDKETFEKLRNLINVSTNEDGRPGKKPKH